MDRRMLLAAAAALTAGLWTGRTAAQRPGSRAASGATGPGTPSDGGESAHDPARPPALTMGTAPAGTAEAQFGPAWGVLVTRATGLPMLYRATKGPNETVLLLDGDRIDLGVAPLGTLRQAWGGAGAWTRGVPLRGFRALFPTYDTVLHGIARAGAGIDGFGDLAGRRIGIGPQGAADVATALAALGLNRMRLLHGGIDDQVAQLLQGQLDACVTAAGTPVPAFARAIGRTGLVFLGLTAPEAARLQAAVPDFVPARIPSGTYPGLAEEVRTVGMATFALCRTGLSDSLAYAITGAVLDHPEGLAAAGVPAAEMDARAIGRDTVLPLHPGAARYYRERNIRVPEIPA